jgi:hypothetical protein
MPTADWCEVRDGRDFFAWREPVDWIVSNPPYSIFSEFLRHAFRVAQDIVFLIPVNKAFNSDRMMREIWTWGGIPTVYVVGGGVALVDAERPVLEHRSDIGGAGQQHAAEHAVVMHRIGGAQHVRSGGAAHVVLGRLAAEQHDEFDPVVGGPVVLVRHDRPTVPSPPMRFRAFDVAAATGGRLVGPDVAIDGASFDSRSIRPGQLFVPIIDQRDGHDFIDDALAAGAAAYLTSRPGGPGTAIEVDDTLGALMRLATERRSHTDATVIGITCTVQSNPARGASRSRTCRSECSASRPVTKWMRGRAADKDGLARRRCREFIMRAVVSRCLPPPQGYR